MEGQAVPQQRVTSHIPGQLLRHKQIRIIQIIRIIRRIRDLHTAVTLPMPVVILLLLQATAERQQRHHQPPVAECPEIT